jgi:D-alanyl-D-alanine carboxypeptidase
MKRLVAASALAAIAVVGCSSTASVSPSPSQAAASNAAATTAPSETAPSSAPATAAPELWSAPARTTTPMSATDAAAVDAAVKKALADSSDATPGAWVGVWSPTKGFYVQAYGNAVMPGTAATVADHNYIGSLTKTVTATAVLQQVAAGTMSLGDTVARLDPALAETFPAIADITVEQLIGMTSGLPDYANEPKGVIGMVATDPTRQFSAEDLIRIGLEANTIQAPGTPGYSTTNYIILGELLAAVTGKSPEDVINGVFEQAGMTQSALLPPPAALPDPSSHGYLGTLGAAEVAAFGGPTLDGTTDVTDWRLDWGRAGGGAHSTIEDLGTWGSLGLGTALLPKALGDARLSSTNLTLAGPYGLGIIDMGNGWIGHSGQVLGWEALVKMNTETGAVMAIMVNSSAGLSGVETAVEPFAAE